ncbi:hybrid sensor histidine kinase/response regulator [Algoriphagus sp. A40]|uniref:hybrid sensor histidine kinase/response regulator n=1 Tax=Algoriphagus sp. A40 TaxID=1945863 RepID=UPI0020C4CE10|nr:hybrid sensor histidine kinase/response regulator [Algoriphagus sp. A40]
MPKSKVYQETMLEKETIRILYVDEDQEEQTLIASILKTAKKNKYVVESAKSIEEALEKLKDTYTVFLVGYKPGKEEQLNLIKEIKALKKYAPLIMLSGINSDNIDEQALSLGVTDYLVKGQFDGSTLERKLQFAIRDARLMESLEKTGRKFQSIFERAADPFILMDEKSKVMEVNPMFVSKFGFNPHDAKPGQEYHFHNMLLEAGAKNKLIQNLDTMLESFDLEASMITTEGNTINTLVSIVKQEEKQYQVLIKDLSSIKAREEEELNQKKFTSTGRMARILAHEVKNPLTTIVLSADQMRLELPKEVMLESGDLIEVILRNCDRINHLVSQLLDSTRFIELNIKKHSLATLLEEALAQVIDRIDLQGIKVLKHFQPEMTDLNLDGEKIKIALINLIVNAIEAMEVNKGELVLKTFQRGNQFRIEICDNGSGIPKENLERIFEPFFTNKTKGSGLGLTNTQNIIFSHGGSIRAKSEVGKGTCFLINLSGPESEV